jgi:hypothetical protein
MTCVAAIFDRGSAEGGQWRRSVAQLLHLDQIT